MSDCKHSFISGGYEEDYCEYCGTRISLWQRERIREHEAKLERVREIRKKVNDGIEASAALDDEIGVYWQEVFLDMIDKALADE